MFPPGMIAGGFMVPSTEPPLYCTPACVPFANRPSTPRTYLPAAWCTSDEPSVPILSICGAFVVVVESALLVYCTPDWLPFVNLPSAPLLLASLTKLVCTFLSIGAVMGLTSFLSLGTIVFTLSCMGCKSEPSVLEPGAVPYSTKFCLLALS